MAVNRKLYTDGAFAFVGAGWGVLTNAVYTGGSAQATAGAGDTCTISGVTGYAHYLLATVWTAGSVFTLSIDGVVQTTPLSTSRTTGQRYRVLIPLARGLTDTAHTFVLTNLNGGNLIVEGILSVTGTKIAPVKGNFVALGDSITQGVGSYNNYPGQIGPQAWAARCTRMLTARLQRSIVQINKGVPSDHWVGTSSTLFGLLYRLYTDVVPNAPEILTLLGATNDVNSGNTPPGDFGENIHSGLCFIEDAFATDQMAVVLGTPTYVGPDAYLNAPPPPYSNVFTQGSQQENYLLAITTIRAVASQFSWLSVAYVYEMMAEQDGLVYPNANNDFGVHPNDAGHGVIAVEFYRAIMARLTR